MQNADPYFAHLIKSPLFKMNVRKTMNFMEFKLHKPIEFEKENVKDHFLRM